jgi:cyclohexadieny/prephenate dehydrogenase
MSFERVAIIGLGLLGGSIGLAVRQAHLPGLATIGYDSDPQVRLRATERGLAQTICETAAEAVGRSRPGGLCVPVGAMEKPGREIAGALAPGALVSDVGSSKQTVSRALAQALPGHCVIPGAPGRGHRAQRPRRRLRLAVPPPLVHRHPARRTPTRPKVAALVEFWESLGAMVDTMDVEHHDLVLAVTSHIPHLIAYTIVGTASGSRERHSQRGDQVLGRRLPRLHPHRRVGPDDVARRVPAQPRRGARDARPLPDRPRADARGDPLRATARRCSTLFSRTRSIRRSIVALGQDDARPDFGRKHNGTRAAKPPRRLRPSGGRGGGGRGRSSGGEPGPCARGKSGTAAGDAPGSVRKVDCARPAPCSASRAGRPLGWPAGQRAG